MKNVNDVITIMESEIDFLKRRCRKMKKYQVLQGKISFLGCGDYTIMGEYDTLKEAKSAFNDLKWDTTGWNLSPHEVLETLIIKHGSLEDIIDYQIAKGVR